MDGRAVVLKHLPAAGDWLTRAADGLGRTRVLWESGLLGRLEPAVDHGTLEITATGDHDVVVMRDLSDRLWPAGAPLEREAIGDGLAGLARLHQLGQRVVADGGVDDLQLCSVGARYAMFAPGLHAHDEAPNPHPFRDGIDRAWGIFDETVDADVVAAVDAVHRDPDRLGRRIVAAGGRPTILHGDAKPENLGISGGRLTAIDWGELTGVGPAEVDVAWFAVMSTRSRFAADPSEVFALYETVSGVSLDPIVVDLACIGSLAQMGFSLAGTVRDARRPETQQAAARLLGWWVERVLASLDRVGLP
jgi:hypothetical protein